MWSPIVVGAVCFVVMWFLHAPTWAAFGFGILVMFLAIIDNDLEGIKRGGGKWATKSKT